MEYIVTLETFEGKRLFMHFKSLTLKQIKSYLETEYSYLKIIKIEEMGKNGV